MIPRRALATALGVVLLGAAPSALAEPPAWQPGEPSTAPLRGEISERDEPRTSDGVYGRFGGDLFLSLGAGAAFGDELRGAVLGRALYYHSLALAAAYEDGLGADARPERLLSLELELRPLFLPRWALDAQTSSALADLVLDSLSLGAGVFVADPGDDPTTGLELSLGLSLPLQADARGFWLEARGAFRPGYDAARFEGLLLASFSGALLTPLVK